MSNALISYSFDDEPVRVVMIAGDPWFVATDLAKSLGYREAFVMTRNLDDDEKGTHVVSTLGGMQEMNIVSESGMYAAIFKSRKDEAQRFRKWVTAEVLPELRRTGKYLMHDHEPPPQIATDLDVPRLQAGVAVIREARRLFGPQAARNLWVQVGLPPVIADSDDRYSGDPLAEPLKIWLADKASTTIGEAADGMGLKDIDHSTRYRIGQLLALWGWRQRTAKVASGKAARVFSRPDALPTGGVA
tara:strand:- start:257 stop:991 length:735 start_codon:yes stop_codon:yes gene_type:complete